ncbi:MAG: hypothetical protein ACLS3W_00635 [Clostridia bacterium]
MERKKTRVYAFVGPSGTGKSYRAQMVASANDIHHIIDDGILINENEVLAGTSAKKAPTKIETVKHALFIEKKEQDEMKKALKKYKPDSILILGTSNKMVEKIQENLGLPKIEKTIYINEVATEDEMEKARNMRVTQGKHVIPVPTFEIKKDFSGYILDPLQIFRSKGKGGNPYISEKSIIRPTFSYLGNFTISDSVFRQIAEQIANNMPSVYEVTRTRVENYGDGISIYMEAIINYGNNIIDVMQELKNKTKKEIEKQTAMNVLKVDLVAKGIHMEEE